MNWRKEKKIIMSLLIIGLFSTSIIFANVNGFIESEKDEISVINQFDDISTVELDNGVPYLTATNFSWTAIQFVRHSHSLLDVITGNTFTYGVSDDEIYIQEIDTYLCQVALYATIPVFNGYLAFSCDLKVECGHNEPDQNKDDGIIWI